MTMQNETWLTSAQVRARQGNISDMCLWRWTRSPEIQFPKPDDVRGGRKFWRLSSILEWEAGRAAKSQVTRRPVNRALQPEAA